eukprot:CAMPEP_0202698612 /NCGR_PEP_ID=MMETSP1385-20130828/11875_1 /ASSEMBLY_ACC=CAM_ASM_000861 /TAXON_ID=933848 /ORGANISM="Elphidium margaritaceum" /LENGTH=651 /DNA_ID=CAMNT_0049355365 /DNA_START=51 /DNA_END=2009 /DNA_ORIENTATION=-
MSLQLLFSLCLYYLVSGIHLDPRIINGVDLSANEYPWVASLRVAQLNQLVQQSVCTGSLIQVHPPIILTAAHCFKSDDHEVYYNATDGTIRHSSFQYNGTSNTTTTTTVIIELFVDINRTYTYDASEPQDSFVELQFADLSEVYIHEEYNLSDPEAPTINVNDIALIIFKDYNGTELDDFADLLPTLPTQQLAGEDPCCQIDEQLVSIGYGHVDNESSLADQLQSTEVENTSPLTCYFAALDMLNTTYNRSSVEQEFAANPVYNLICTIGNESNVCSGDSGGPLFRWIADVQEVELVGVANSVLGACDDPDWAAFSVSIAHHYDWMQSTIEEALTVMTTTMMLETSTTEDMVTTTEDMTTTSLTTQDLMTSTSLTTQDMNSTTVTVDEDIVFSIHGSFGVYDGTSGDLFTAMIGVNSDCSKVQFSLHSPSNVWFAIGLGGEYDHHESSEEADSDESHSYNSSEAFLMNGYAIVSAGIGVNGVYESILEPGAAPRSQEELGGTNDLDCAKSRVDGRRVVVCVRDYDTGDTLGDFNEFVQGRNPMIFAYGPIASNGALLQHGVNILAYGDAEVSAIYLEQKNDLCGYAEQYASELLKEEKEDEAWMIVGIVFIVLFVIAVGVIIYLAIKGNKRDSGSGKAGYQPTSQVEIYER